MYGNNENACKAGGGIKLTEEQKRVVLLLNNYRDMKLARDLQRIEKEVGYDPEILCSPEKFAEETGITDIDYSGNERKLTIKAVKLINKAVKDIRENEEEGEIYYWVLYYTYLCDKIYKTNERYEKTKEKVKITSYTKYYCYHHMAIELMRQRLKMQIVSSGHHVQS